MDALKEAIATLGIPGSIAVVIVGVFGLLQLIGEFLEVKGKIVPEFLKVRKFFQRKKKEREEAAKLLTDVKTLLADVNSHYSADCIQERNEWMSKVNDTMSWVYDRAEVYDKSIESINKTLEAAAEKFGESIELTERLFIEASRDRIIDFAEKVSDPMRLVSREEFNRIFKVYDAYEAFLIERNKTNGEVEVAHTIIVEAYEEHMRNHSFTENRRNMDN